MLTLARTELSLADPRGLFSSLSQSTLMHSLRLNQDKVMTLRTVFEETYHS